MASNTNIGTFGPLSRLEEAVLKGVRRSRFSVHFNTHRMRRWLLVQLVSVPAEDAREEDDAQPIPAAQWQSQRPLDLSRMVDEYRTTQYLRNWW